MDGRAARAHGNLDSIAESLTEIKELADFNETMKGLVDCRLDPIETLTLESDDQGSPMYLLPGPGFNGNYYLDFPRRSGEGVKCELR
jgi:hypothetical protein